MFPHVLPPRPAYYFFGFRSVFHPCFIRGSRISRFATFRDECSIGGAGTSPSRHFGMVQKQVTQLRGGWGRRPRATPPEVRQRLPSRRTGGSLADASSTPATQPR